MSSLDTINIGVKARLKHGDLMKAATRSGGQSALAKRLGVDVGTFGAWCNLKACPPTCPEEIHASSKWTPESLRKLEADLFDVTGKTLVELFPSALRQNRAFLAAPKTTEAIREVEIAALLDHQQRRMLLPSPVAVAETLEMQDNVRAVLRTLSSRERQVMEMTYGLNGSQPQSLTEIAVSLGVTRERIRQIAEKAKRKIRESPYRKRGLLDYA